MNALFTSVCGIAGVQSAANKEVLEAIMTRTVTLWRCTCGIGIKVISETGSSPPAKQTVLCPKCQTAHAIHADTITSIMEDTYKLSPALARCKEKERLLVGQNKALDIYTRITAELAEAAGMMAQTEFQFLYDKVLTARQFLLQIRQQLIEHTAEHGC
jgi:hypothetical protein